MAIYTGKTNLIDKVVVTNGGAPEEMDFVYVTNASGKRELVFEKKAPAPDDNTQEAVPVKTKWTASITGATGLKRPYPPGEKPVIYYDPGADFDAPREFRLTGSPVIYKRWKSQPSRAIINNWSLFRDENVVIIHEKARTIQPNRLFNYATNTDSGKVPKPYYPPESDLYKYHYGGLLGFGVPGKGPTYYVWDASYAKVGNVQAFFDVPSHTIFEAPKVISLDATGYSGLDIGTNYHGTVVRTYCGINVTKTSKLHRIAITSRITVKEGNSAQQVYSDFYVIDLKINEEGEEGVEPASMVSGQGVVYPYNGDRLRLGLGSGQLHLNIKETK